MGPCILNWTCNCNFWGICLYNQSGQIIIKLADVSFNVINFFSRIVFNDWNYFYADIFSKVKDKADDVSKKIQSKVDTVGMKSSPIPQRRSGVVDGNGDATSGSSPRPTRPAPPNKIEVPEEEEVSTTLVITQILMSCLHAWGLDPEVDNICQTKLGLLRPKRLLSFGYLSPSGQMSLLLPGWYKHLCPSNQPENMTATIGHWQISSAVTTQHLLAVISVTNTLMSMSNATFIKSRQTKAPSPEWASSIVSDISLRGQNKI